eukprot:3475103-Amphidinium_carterae.1
MFMLRCVPTLAGLDEDDKSKVATFIHIFLSEALLPTINQGKPAANQLKSICKVCLDHFDGVDRVELDGALSASLTSCETVWKGLLALVDDEYHLAFKDSLLQLDYERLFLKLLLHKDKLGQLALH